MQCAYSGGAVAFQGVGSDKANASQEMILKTSSSEVKFIKEIGLFY